MFAAHSSLPFQVIYGKLKQDVSLDSNTSVGELKDLVEKNTQIARSGQKILVKGKPLTDDNQTLEQVCDALGRGRGGVAFCIG
jgi:hypothetical protein